MKYTTITHCVRKYDTHFVFLIVRKYNIHFQKFSLGYWFNRASRTNSEIVRISYTEAVSNLYKVTLRLITF